MAKYRADKPITLPKGKRTEGTLLAQHVDRITPKSAFLIKLESKQMAECDRLAGKVVPILKGLKKEKK